jgi:hypothetical protein
VQAPATQTATGSAQLGPEEQLPPSEAQKLCLSAWYSPRAAFAMAEASQSLQHASSCVPTATVTQSAFPAQLCEYFAASSVPSPVLQRKRSRASRRRRIVCV